jgi:hypothetical protein
MVVVGLVSHSARRCLGRALPTNLSDLLSPSPLRDMTRGITGGFFKMLTKRKSVVLILTLAGILAAVWLAIAVQNSRDSVRRLIAQGRLFYVCCGLRRYSEANGQLPPLWKRDKDGHVLYSWRFTLLPYIGSPSDCYGLNFNLSWNSEPNRTLLQNSQELKSLAYVYLSENERRNTASIMAFLGPGSAWDATTGRPKVPVSADAIMLIHVPQSNIEPWEPRDITEKELLTRVERGEEVFFMDADSRSGRVQIVNGKLDFARMN